MQVGFRPENIMIATTQPESSTYHRPSLPHISTASSVTSSEHWASARSSTSSAPTPAQLPTSARGAANTSSPFRHSSSVSHSSTPTTPHHPNISTPSEQPINTSQPHSGPASSTTTSTTSSSVNSPNSRQSPARSKRTSEDSAPVVLQSLSQIVDLPRQEPLTHSPPKRNRSGEEDRQRYEISGMPVADVIEMVAALLTKITATNDQQNPQLNRNIPPPDSSGMSGTTNSVLAFHGKNVPSITILSYLSRIHKYCPTTYEVFLSLLVYFDRMTDRVNKNPSLNWKGGASTPNGELVLSGASDPYNFSHFFVVDSFNIHRLVIAGVTCASKFFSDVFYTNSRYAKVCILSLSCSISPANMKSRLVVFHWLN